MPILNMSVWISELRDKTDWLSKKQWVETDSAEQLGGVRMDERTGAAVEVLAEEEAVDGEEEVADGEEEEEEEVDGEEVAVDGGEGGGEVDGEVDHGKEAQQEVRCQDIPVLPKEGQETISEVKHK